MIDWMQKHRKYLVVTIWISTIAFVGAGFVGWGSYNYGNSGSTVAEVEDKEIEMSALQLSYQNLYEQYNSMTGGQLTQQQAKEMGLEQIALNNLLNQAHFVTLADDYGIIVSDEEIAGQLQSISGFQKDGRFSRETYKQALANMSLKPKEFESMLADDIKLQKLLGLLSLPQLEKENNALGAVVADKLEYKMLSLDDVDVSVSKKEIQEYYDEYIQEFQTERSYTFSAVYEDAKDVEYTAEDINATYEKIKYDYRDDEGKIKPLDDIRQEVINAYKMQRAQKRAQVTYVDFKEGEDFKTKTLKLNEYERFDPDAWEKIQEADEGDYIKPIADSGRYAILRLETINEPSPKPLEQVKDEVRQQALYEKSLKALKTRAEKMQNSFSGTQTDGYVTPDDMSAMEALNEYEAGAFAKHLFSANENEGVFSQGERAIVYRIVDQKLQSGSQDVEGTKGAVYEEALLEQLKDEHDVQVFIK